LANRAASLHGSQESVQLAVGAAYYCAIAKEAGRVVAAKTE
jgi:hypothetical protein